MNHRLCLVPLLCLFGLTLPARLWAAPRVPTDPGEVLERLPGGVADPVTREIRALTVRLRAEPTNASLAAQVARRQIQRSRVESDPRHLGYAQSALAPWWQDLAPPVDILILRATIRQSRHEFHPALTDLENAVARAPRDAQAWLTKATVEQVLGNPAAARRSCEPLSSLAGEWIAVTASAMAASLNGAARESYQQLAALCDRPTGVDPELRSWALTAAGEIAVRLGDISKAGNHFRTALELAPRDAYLLGAYADLLLDTGRASEVGSLLAAHARADALLLRLALAETATGSGDRHRQAMQDRFDASRLRGDTVHQREESRFALRVLNDVPQALRLATANWQVQREPADARILLESALAARRPDSARPVLDFLRTNRLEDVSLNLLAAQLSPRPTP